jgi:hypothetical protein
LKRTWILWTGTVLAALNLGACGGGGSSGGVAPTLYTIGGTITGLTGGGLSLANGTDTATVAVNSTGFTMPTPLTASSRYALQISAQPSGLICSAEGSAGVVSLTFRSIASLHGPGWAERTRLTRPETTVYEALPRRTTRREHARVK